MATVSFPARCAVAVICGEHLVSQVYPASAPIEVFLDNIIELLNEDLQRRRGAVPLDAGVAYELQRANGTRLDATKSLDDLGIEDGSTLGGPGAARGIFEPQYESLSTGLARAGRSLFIAGHGGIRADGFAGDPTG